MAQKIGMGFLGGLILVQGFVWALFESQGFFWLLIFVPIRSSLSIEIRSTLPPPRVTPGTTLSYPLPRRASLQVSLSLDLSPSLPPKCLPIYYLLQYFFCSVFCIELQLNAKASTNGRVY